MYKKYEDMIKRSLRLLAVRQVKGCKKWKIKKQNCKEMIYRKVRKDYKKNVLSNRKEMLKINNE